MKLKLFALFFGFFFSASSLLAATYEIDRGHSNVGFQIRHLVISKTSGRFDQFSGTVEMEPKKLQTLKTEATIDAASINTNEPKRDTHLKSADFFDVDNPKKPENKTIKFKSSKVTDVKGNKGKLHGELIMHGVTKPVTLDLEFLGEQKDPWGNEKIGFSATGKLNRKDFGLTWNKALETGGVLVGEEVEIAIDIEAQSKK
jgi:polyisoprenoid-binding protein YceI